MGVLDGKSAIVTGSARGIGRATAELLVRTGRPGPHQRPRRRRRRAGGLRDQRARRPSSPATSRKPGAADELVQKAIDSFGKIDIIVNNAGYTLDAPIHKMSDEHFQAMLDIHTIVPFRVIRAAAPHLREPAKKEREEGKEVFRKIVNISSTSGTFGNAGQANYSSGKAGVVGLTKTIAKEWGQFKVNVNAVAFGFIDTRLTQAKVDENTMEKERREDPARDPRADAPDGLDADPARPPRHAPRRPPAASSSCARRGRTTSTARRCTSPAGCSAG